MPKRSGKALYKRGSTWWLDFTHEGQRYVRRLGKGISKTAAGEIAQTVRGDVLRGRAGIGHKRRDVTFDKAADLFLRWARTNKKPLTLRFYEDCIGCRLKAEVEDGKEKLVLKFHDPRVRLGKHFAGRRLSQITPFLVEKYKVARKDDAPVRVNRELTTLKAIFNRATEWGSFEGSNPVRKVKLLPESRGRLRFLDHDEEARLRKACREPLRTIVLLGIHAGLRLTAEALTLRWASVDLAGRRLYVEGAYAKNHETRSVPLNRVLLEALTAHRARSAQKGPAAYVFLNRQGKPLGSIRTAFETARTKAGLGPDVTPHTTRHTFASRLVMASVDLRTVQELGGWKSLRMVERYGHLSPAHLAGAVERIADGSPAFTRSNSRGTSRFRRRSV